MNRNKTVMLLENVMSNGINLNQLHVYIGHQQKIATISIPIDSDSEISLKYDSTWITDGFAISPHLPLHGDFDYRAVRNYLQNLLPEGKGLDEITSHTTVSKNNTFGLIKIIGEETSGALSFRTNNSLQKTTEFREVTIDELNHKLSLFKNVDESITYWDGKTRLSVAGVQDKLNLLEIDGKLGFGEGLLCSNKIFKFETGKVPCIAVNELFTMILANESGLKTPPVEIRTYGGVRTFVIERFDRHVSADRNNVLRRHVIDGCQATNLPPSYKYERQHGDDGDGIFIRDGVSFPKLFALDTLNSTAYQATLIRWMTFNILMRNYDAHGKNISFFTGKQGLELTPFYDLVNIEAIIREIQSRQKETLYSRENSLSQSYAMSIGDYEVGSAGNFTNPITAYMLADFANEFGMSLPRLKLLIEQTIKSVLASINTTKTKVYEYELSQAEITHIDLCINIINESANELSNELAQLADMKALF